MHRRTLLRLAGAGTVTSGISGCLGNLGARTTEQAPTPVDLSGSKLDDEGGMVIGEHGGPNRRIFYTSNTPDGHDNPAWFHTLTFGLFPHYFEHRRDGWETRAIYVTDYSAVDYEVTTGSDRKQISTFTAAETFGDVETMTYVVESDVLGGMGPALISFSVGDDAQAFADEHGGRTLTFDDITPTFVSTYARR